MALRKKIMSRLVLILLAAAIAVPVGIHIHEKRIPNRNFARLEKARPEYEANFNESMQRELLERLPEELDAPGFTWSADTLSVTSEFTWEKDRQNGWQDWNCTCNVEISGPDSFLQLSDRERKELLDRARGLCDVALYDHYQAFIAQLEPEGELNDIHEYPGLSVLGYWLDERRNVNLRLLVGNFVFEPDTESNGSYLNGEYVNAISTEPKNIKAPYVGMSESRIGKTSLGEPDPVVRHNDEQLKGGKHVTANLYDFKVNGWTVFTARCVQGTVTEIFDFRDSVDTSRPHRDPSNSTKTYVYDDNDDDYYDDPYDVYDYYDPEDFYYDHEDDFYDYEDAEDYFYEHDG